LSEVRFVIPNRAESPVRNLLFPGNRRFLAANKTALSNANFQTDPLPVNVI